MKSSEHRGTKGECEKGASKRERRTPTTPNEASDLLQGQPRPLGSEAAATLTLSPPDKEPCPVNVASRCFAFGAADGPLSTS